MVLGGTVLGAALQSRALDWQRAAELSCDRAALIVVQDTRVAQSVIMKLAGGSTDARYKDQLNVDAFVAQAAAYDEVAASSRTGRMVSSK